VPILGDGGGQTQPGYGGGFSPHASQSDGVLEATGNPADAASRSDPPVCPPASQEPATEESAGSASAALCAAGPAPAEPAPILDKNIQNVPRDCAPRRMGPKHYRIRMQIRDRMRVWKRAGLVQWWVTLTSSPDSPKDRLRRDFQAWRKRLARSLEIDVGLIQYIVVDTREGHGVLHLVLAIPRDAVGRSGFQIDYSEAGQWWQEIHGARQVKFKRIGRADSDVRKLSQYLVSQYMVNQGTATDLLVRVSGSRVVLPLARLRQAVFGILTAKARAYQEVRTIDGWPAVFEMLWRAIRKLHFREAREAWDSLLERGWFDAGSLGKWCLIGAELQEV